MIGYGTVRAPWAGKNNNKRISKQKRLTILCWCAVRGCGSCAASCERASRPWSSTVPLSPRPCRGAGSDSLPRQWLAVDADVDAGCGCLLPGMTRSRQPRLSCGRWKFRMEGRKPERGAELDEKDSRVVDDEDWWERKGEADKSGGGKEPRNDNSDMKRERKRQAG